MKHLIIYGSSSGATGKTYEIVQTLNHLLKAQLINLSDHNFSYFDYTHQNKEDGFKYIAEQMISADCIIFATPVYWYAMSGQLKVFFDRLTDLTTLRKPWGRQLKGKLSAFIATGDQPKLPEGFEIPFKKTAEYFGMKFQGHTYVCTDTAALNPLMIEHELNQFVCLLKQL